MSKFFDPIVLLLLISASIALPVNLIAEDPCPVTGDTITITGQVSIRQVNGLKLPELHPKTFPNRFQPVCVLIPPYDGAGGVHVDRSLGVVHIWLVSPKQRDTNGSIDWTHPEPIPTDVLLEITGKLIGQSLNRLSAGLSLDVAGAEVTLEISHVKNVDAEINGSIDTWKNDCRKWVDAQLGRPDITAAWKNHPKAGELPKLRRYIIEPFADSEPECAADVEFQDSKGIQYSVSFARWPYVITNIGSISLSSERAK